MTFGLIELATSNWKWDHGRWVAPCGIGCATSV